MVVKAAREGDEKKVRAFAMEYTQNLGNYEKFPGLHDGGYAALNLREIAFMFGHIELATFLGQRGLKMMTSKSTLEKIRQKLEEDEAAAEAAKAAEAERRAASDLLVARDVLAPRDRLFSKEEWISMEDAIQAAKTGDNDKWKRYLGEHPHEAEKNMECYRDPTSWGGGGTTGLTLKEIAYVHGHISDYGAARPDYLLSSHVKLPGIDSKRMKTLAKIRKNVGRTPNRAGEEAGMAFFGVALEFAKHALT